jgi:hypothetical protein
VKCACPESFRIPAELPDPLPQPNVLFKKKRNHGYIGAKAIEENEKDARRAQKQAKRDTKDQRREGNQISRDLRQEHIARHKETEEAESVSKEDTDIEDADNGIGALESPSGIGDQLTTLSSDKLLDPLIT